MRDEATGFREGEHIAKISVFTLLALGIIELVFSQISGSISLFADGVGSVSDATITFFVWTGLRFARKPPNRRFPYGYYKVESLTALLAALSLVGVSVFILLRSYRGLVSPQNIALPYLAMVILAAAGLISLYRALQMRHIANRFDILSLKVDSSNSIRDAASSFIALGSVFGASIGLRELDAIGGILIAIYVLTVSYIALKESSLILVDAFHEPELTKEIESLIKSNKHVRGISALRLRRAGPFIIGALEIIVDGDMTVRQMHTISTELENSIRTRIAALRRLTIRAIPG